MVQCAVVNRTPERKPPLLRFLALVRIVPDGGCWEWQGSRSKDGYGQFVLDGRRGHKKIRVSPYRWIWEFTHNQPMPEGTEPDHTCNNRKCCNPAHIEPVTHSENQKRSYQRGRKRTGRDYTARPRPTHCPRGHEYTPENTMPGKALKCRACNRAWCIARNERVKAAKA